MGKQYSLDQAGWDLTNSAFKELDIWSYNYHQNDRDLAINRTRFVFSETRLSTQEPLWDMPEPVHIRGKKQILSSLSLLQGNVQQVSTPRIRIQCPNDESIGKLALT